MANKKISDMTAIVTYAEGDIIPVIDISEVLDADKNKGITKAVLFDSNPDFGGGLSAGGGISGTPDFGDGLTFGNETLDQYDEGTWTPTVVYVASDGDLTYDHQIARYTRVGNMVTLFCDIQWNETTASGIVTLLGIPFTSANITNFKIGTAVSYDDIVTAGAIMVRIQPNTVIGDIRRTKADATGTEPADEADTGSDSNLQISLTYMV